MYTRAHDLLYSVHSCDIPPSLSIHWVTLPLPCPQDKEQNGFFGLTMVRATEAASAARCLYASSRAERDHWLQDLRRASEVSRVSIIISILLIYFHCIHVLLLFYISLLLSIRACTDLCALHIHLMYN
jgi:hypothetical protein